MGVGLGQVALEQSLSDSESLILIGVGAGTGCIRCMISRFGPVGVVMVETRRLRLEVTNGCVLCALIRLLRRCQLRRMRTFLTRHI